MRKGLSKVRKELAGRFYQLLSGHAAMAERLTRIGQVPNDKCWWCGRQRRETVALPSVHQAPTPDAGNPKDVGEEWEAPRAPSVRLLFRNEQAIPAILEFLGGARVGRMPGMALFGVEEDEERLDQIELWAQAEEEGWSGESEEEGGPGLP